MEEEKARSYRVAAQVADLAMGKRTTLATAESCTAGLVAHLLAQTAGVSAVLLGGIVAYANEAKSALLAVPPELLLQHGAVSAPVAIAMARGARARLGSDLAVSTTGIAGPGGGSVDKPVGLVYVAISAAGEDRCQRFLFSGSRVENMERAAHEALLALHEALSTTNP